MMNWADVVHGIVSNPLTILNLILVFIVVIIVAKYTGLHIEKGHLRFSDTSMARRVLKEGEDPTHTAWCAAQHEKMKESLDESLLFLERETCKIMFYSNAPLPQRMESGLWYLKKHGNHATAKDVQDMVKDNPEVYDYVCVCEPDLKIF